LIGSAAEGTGCLAPLNIALQLIDWITFEFTALH
jgi:hypothetical protein